MWRFICLIMNESKYWEYWLVFLENGSQNKLSILKKKTLTSNQIGLPFPFWDVYLSIKLSKFWFFVAPPKLIPRSNIWFKEQ